MACSNVLPIRTSKTGATSKSKSNNSPSSICVAMSVPISKDKYTTIIRYHAARAARKPTIHFSKKKNSIFATWDFMSNSQCWYHSCQKLLVLKNPMIKIIRTLAGMNKGLWGRSNRKSVWTSASNSTARSVSSSRYESVWMSMCLRPITGSGVDA